MPKGKPYSAEFTAKAVLQDTSAILGCQIVFSFVPAVSLADRLGDPLGD